MLAFRVLLLTAELNRAARGSITSKIVFMSQKKKRLSFQLCFRSFQNFRFNLFKVALFIMAVDLAELST